MFPENFSFYPQILSENEIENMKRVNFPEKLSARYLMSRGLEVSRRTCEFRASFDHPIKKMGVREYKHVPDFAVRNPRRPDSHWAFIEVTSAMEKRLPAYKGEDRLVPDVTKAKQFEVMQNYPEVRYVQIGRESLQKWAAKIGLR